MNYPLKIRQVCFFILAFFPIVKIFMMPSILAGFANEDMWISSLINLVIDFITLLFIISLCKRAKTNFFGLLEQNFGRIASKIILSLYFICFMLKAIVPLNEQKDYVVLTLYTLIPHKIYFLPIFFVAFYLCLKPLRVLGRAADILWIFSLIGIILLMALSIPNAQLDAIFPVGANSFTSILRGSYSTLNWNGDIIYLIFFIGNFKYESKSTLKIIISFLISSLLVILFMIIFYSIFTSIGFRQRFALTEVSKYTAVINNIGRFDYFGIIFILFSSVFAVILPMYFASKLLTLICSFKKKWISSLIVVLIQAFILIFLTEYYLGIESFMKNFGGAIFLVFSNILPIIFSIFFKRGVKNEINAKG